MSVQRYLETKHALWEVNQTLCKCAQEYFENTVRVKIGVFKYIFSSIVFNPLSLIFRIEREIFIKAKVSRCKVFFQRVFEIMKLINCCPTFNERLKAESRTSLSLWSFFTGEVGSGGLCLTWSFCCASQSERMQSVGLLRVV